MRPDPDAAFSLAWYALAAMALLAALACAYFLWRYHRPRVGGKPAARRSPHWPAVRRAHLVREPACAACATHARLEVHHVRPFHLFPELELDPANLLTLCESPSHNCHFTFGHAYNWAGYNPHVREDSAQFFGRVKFSHGVGNQYGGRGVRPTDGPESGGD